MKNVYSVRKNNNENGERVTMNVPEDLRYSAEHEWVRFDAKSMIATMGITDYAQEKLGDVVYVELPEEGGQVEAAEPFGSVESVKAVSEIYMPVSGEITAINEALEEAPELVNQEPYNDGWIIEVKPGDPDEINTLMSSSEYLETLKGEE